MGGAGQRLTCSRLRPRRGASAYRLDLASVIWNPSLHSLHGVGAHAAAVHADGRESGNGNGEEGKAAIDSVTYQVLPKVLLPAVSARL
jgi:hypothetical protein